MSKTTSYRVDVTSIRCYSSKDLLRWKNEGLVLQAVPADSAHDLHPSKVCERPKVVFNPRTKKFVMWLHIDSEDYKSARAGVAVADQPTGPFTYLESIRPEGQDSRDQTLFQDDDGRAYRIYSSENNDTTYISLLTDDYLKHSGKFARVFAKRRMEAQVLFKHAGKYWFIASGGTGWDPNRARSAVADSICGPWTELGNPCRGRNAARTYGRQSTFVFPVAGKKNAFIFMADRWNKKNLPDSRYLWLPLQFKNNRPTIQWTQTWDLSFFDRKKPAPGKPAATRKKGVRFRNTNGTANHLSETVDAPGCGWYDNSGADAGIPIAAGESVKDSRRKLDGERDWFGCHAEDQDRRSEFTPRWPVGYDAGAVPTWPPSSFGTTTLPRRFRNRSGLAREDW